MHRSVCHCALATAAIGLGATSALGQCDPMVVADTPSGGGGSAGVEVDGNIVYVNARNDGFQTIDVTNPLAPVVLHSTGWAALGAGTEAGLDYADGLCLIARITPASSLYDVSNPAAPVQLSTLPGSGHGTCALGGDYAYGAVGATIESFDISTPAAPVALGSLATGTEIINDMQVSGTAAYLCQRTDGLVIVDVSNPAAPAVLTTIATVGGDAWNVEVVGNLAYVADFTGELNIFDISTPATPVLLGSVAGPNPGTHQWGDVGISGNVAYMLGGGSDIWAVDVSNSSAPVVIGSTPTAGLAGGDRYLAAGGDYAYRTSVNTSFNTYVFDMSSCQPGMGDLSLEMPDCPDDAFPGEPGYQVQVEVWMRNLSSAATGFQAFIEHDELVLGYRGDLSSYTNSPFPLHIQSIATANVAAGEIRIDGSDDLGDPGETADSLLATLVFDVLSECDMRSVDFDLTQTFDSELSFFGEAFDTTLVDTGDVELDDTAPVITVPANITQAADADVADGCTSAIVTFSVSANDACDGAITPVVDFPSGTAFPVGTTTVTVTATDGCGNVSMDTFDVTVTPTNVVNLSVQLVGVTTATTRCIHFVADDCSATADIMLSFDATGLFSGSIEVPCGNWTMLCAKDMQHTLWDTSALTLSGPVYNADTTLSLLAGDTDGDGDVDINDVTWVVATLGDAYQDGGCPWDGTRDGDFSNNGTVFTEDYSLMTPQWLMSTSCACSGASPAAPATKVDTSDLEPWLAARVDVIPDGVVDWRDIYVFEARHGLPHTLSDAIKAGPKDDRKSKK